MNKKLTIFFWNYLKQSKFFLIISLFFAALVSITTMAPAPAAGKFFDEALASNDYKKLILFCTIIFFIFIADSIAKFIYRYLVRVTFEKAAKDLRTDLFKKLIILSPQQSKQYNSGKMTTHLLSDINNITNSSNEIVDIFLQPAIVLVLLGYLFYLNWYLTAFCLLAIPVLVVIAKFFGKRAKRYRTEIQKTTDLLSAQAIESFEGKTTIHSFNKSTSFIDKFNQLNLHTYKFLRRLIRNQEAVAPFTRLLTTSVGVAMAGFGGYLVIQGSISKGDLLSFVLAAGLMQQPIKIINRLNIKIQEVFVSISRIHQIITIPLDPISKMQDIQTDKTNDSPVLDIIEFKALNIKSLSFNYNIEEQASSNALDDINIELNKGDKIAFVGRSGSGKSTLALLIMRFLDPTNGEILLNNQEISNLNIDTYRNMFSYVSQNPFLFNRTIKENLLIANKNVTDNEIWECLEKVNLHELINGFEDKLNHRISISGSNFSGGEKQRLAIARAFLKPSPIVVFDEATSHLDSHSEELVQKSLALLLENKSAIIIAHRLATVKLMDRIYLFDQGKILEKGNPDNLINKNDSHFKKLWNAQQLS